MEVVVDSCVDCASCDACMCLCVCVSVCQVGAGVIQSLVGSVRHPCILSLAGLLSVFSKMGVSLPVCLHPLFSLHL